ncbi:hypothetical protein [Pseudonocardia xishanensis]|uniref:Anti-sigma-M factor RsmA n=1 Tax=Pseudonocardia xishanensis TaxID=630995 RepID=A0ABP8RN53_9PSEU
MTTGGGLTRIAEAAAGLPDEESAARVLAAGEPDTARVLRALAATRADLAAVPRERLPAAVAGALATGFDAIDRGAAGSTPAPVDATGRRAVPPTGRRRRRGLLLTAAAAALVGVALTGPPPSAPPTDLRSAASRVLAERTRDVGTLADPPALVSCLLRAGASAPTGPLLAGRPVRLGGTDGVLLVIGTGIRGVVRAVVPTPGCDRILADLTVGG